MANKKTIIFDFDGTIADTLGIALNIYNQKIAPVFKSKKVDREDLEYLRSQRPSRKLLKTYNLSLVKIPLILKRGRAEFKKEVGKAKLQPGIGEVLKKLSWQASSLGILSSNSKENIKLFLKNNQLLDIFDFFYTNSRVFGKHRGIERIIKQRKLDKEHSFYIGDETRDISAAKKAGIKTIAVGWGFNKISALKKEEPDFIVEEPEQLLELLL